MHKDGIIDKNIKVLLLTTLFLIKKNDTVLKTIIRLNNVWFVCKRNV